MKRLRHARKLEHVLNASPVICAPSLSVASHAPEGSKYYLPVLGILISNPFIFCALERQLNCSLPLPEVVGRVVTTEQEQ